LTRRLTLAIVGTVVATLVVAGAGTLVLARLGARTATRKQLIEQVQQVAAAVDSTAIGTGLTPVQRRAQLAVVLRAFRLEGIGFLVVGPAGQVLTTPDGQPIAALPTGMSQSDLDVPALLGGATQTGSNGSLLWAAAPGRRAVSTVIVVGTDHVATNLGTALRWFLVAAASTIAVSVLVAWQLGRRLTNPLREADAATRQIAAGDLGTRLTEPPKSATDELATLTRSINSMAGALERSKGLERQFLLSVSHDLRTPLTSIRGYAEAIADGTAQDAPAAAGVILSEARRLERLVRDLLELAQLDARQFSLDVAPVDLAEAAAATVSGFQPDAARVGVTVAAFATPPGPVVVSGDRDRVAQVVANLVENALKYARSKVDVSVFGGADVATLAVDDDGPGIAPEDQPHVFERLYVTQRVPRRAEVGSGLGLAIVRELVVAMGGTVAAETSPAGGARLVVHLPNSRQ
jgi:two-component system sensor histidine kinase BaeS